MPLFTGPHSLGQSVEWKHSPGAGSGSAGVGGPTRWGNQLNGNHYFKLTIAYLYPCPGPHSLGQSVEWKPACVAERATAFGYYNGNTEAPLAGAIS